MRYSTPGDRTTAWNADLTRQPRRQVGLCEGGAERNRKKEAQPVCPLQSDSRTPPLLFTGFRLEACDGILCHLLV